MIGLSIEFEVRLLHLFIHFVLLLQCLFVAGNASSRLMAKTVVLRNQS
jgi:hypothetical protein